MKNLSQISVILMKNLSHFGHLRLAGMRRPCSRPTTNTVIEHTKKTVDVFTLPIHSNQH